MLVLAALQCYCRDNKYKMQTFKTLDSKNTAIFWCTKPLGNYKFVLKIMHASHYME